MKPERALACAIAQLERWAETICATDVRLSIVVVENLCSVQLTPSEPSDDLPWTQDDVKPRDEWERAGDGDDSAYSSSRDADTLELFAEDARIDAHQS